MTQTVTFASGVTFPLEDTPSGVRYFPSGRAWRAFCITQYSSLPDVLSTFCADAEYTVTTVREETVTDADGNQTVETVTDTEDCSSWSVRGDALVRPDGMVIIYMGQPTASELLAIITGR